MLSKRGNRRRGTHFQPLSWADWFFRRSTVMWTVCLFVCLFLFFIFYDADLFGDSRIKYLINGDEERLREVFFGNTPYLHYCHEHGRKDYIPKKLSKVHQMLEGDFNMAVLNCSQVLPSGKNIFDRFKLRKDWNPIIFGTAPWAGRVQVPPAKLAKEAMHIVNYLGSALAPKEKKLVNDKEFQQECGWSGEERTCILALKGPLYSELQQNSLGNLVKSFYKNKVPIVSVEAKLRWLSFESSGVMKSKFSMRLYAIRNGKRFLSLGAPSTEERMHQFVQDAIDTPLSYYNESRSIKLVKPALRTAQQLPSFTITNNEKLHETSSGVVDDGGSIRGAGAENENDNADRLAQGVNKQQRREQHRREQMDKQSEDFIVRFDEHESCLEEDVSVGGDEDVIELF